MIQRVRIPCVLFILAIFINQLIEYESTHWRQGV